VTLVGNTFANYLISWFRHTTDDHLDGEVVYDDGELTSYYRSTSRFSVQRNGSLTIQPVKVDDAGRYTCNSLKHFHLTVIGK